MKTQGANVLTLASYRADALSTRAFDEGIDAMWAVQIGAYTTTLRAAGRSDGTVRLHQHYLGLLARQSVRVADVDRRAIELWLSNPAWSPETRKSARSVAVVFFRWAQSNEVIERSPAAELLPITVPPAAARPAPESAYDEAMATAGHDVRLMLKLARLAGLRCAEIAGVSSVDLVGDLLYVKGKGGKTRIVPIADPELRAAIEGANGWLFPSPMGGHVTPGWISKVVGRALPPGWTAHQLRHAFATRSYERSPDVLALGKVLGHSKPETTMRYVATPIDSLRAVVAAAA